MSTPNQPPDPNQEPNVPENIHLLMQSLVLERLGKARWMTGSAFAEIGVGQFQSVNWTKDGIEKIRTLHKLLTELGFFSGSSMPPHRVGELEVLADMIGLCILKHGPEPQGPESTSTRRW